jgi:hypothetical protein
MLTKIVTFLHDKKNPIAAGVLDGLLVLKGSESRFGSRLIHHASVSR